MKILFCVVLAISSFSQADEGCKSALAGPQFSILILSGWNKDGESKLTRAGFQTVESEFNRTVAVDEAEYQDVRNLFPLINRLVEFSQQSPRHTARLVLSLTPPNLADLHDIFGSYKAPLTHEVTFVSLPDRTPYKAVETAPNTQREFWGPQLPLK